MTSQTDNANLRQLTCGRREERTNAQHIRIKRSFVSHEGSI